MKRTTIYLSLLVPLLAAGLVSCDQMFSNNLFAGMVQKPVSSGSIAGMSVSEVIDLTTSDYKLKQLAGNPEAKAAALSKLDAAYASAPASASGQDAAIAMAAISLKTVPSAAEFSAKAIGLLTDLDFGSSSGTDASGVTKALTGILPSTIASQLTATSTPPAEFVDMIQAFTEASAAYDKLAGGVGLSGNVYADPALGSGQKMEIATNAVISGIVSTVNPSPGLSVADALWSSLRDPASAGSYLAFPDLNAMVSSGSTVYNLVSAAGLDLGK